MRLAPAITTSSIRISRALSQGGKRESKVNQITGEYEEQLKIAIEQKEHAQQELVTIKLEVEKAYKSWMSFIKRSIMSGSKRRNQI